jgi:hypothetical protein
MHPRWELHIGKKRHTVFASRDSGRESTLFLITAATRRHLSMVLLLIGLGLLPWTSPPVAEAEIVKQLCQPGSTGFNLARARTTAQSSQGHDWGNASRAVDGNRNGDFQRGRSCSHTTNETSPWWYVDLGADFDIGTIGLANRGDWYVEADLLKVTLDVGLMETLARFLVATTV